MKEPEKSKKLFNFNSPQTKTILISIVTIAFLINLYFFYQSKYNVVWVFLFLIPIVATSWGYGAIGGSLMGIFLLLFTHRRTPTPTPRASSACGHLRITSAT